MAMIVRSMMVGRNPTTSGNFREACAASVSASQKSIVALRSHIHLNVAEPRQRPCDPGVLLGHLREAQQLLADHVVSA